MKQMQTGEKYFSCVRSKRVSEFLKLPQEKLDEVVKDTPETVMDVIVSVMESLCGKIGATKKETQECVSRVRERRMGYLFENMEKMNIQEERRNTAQARAELEKAQEKLKKAEDDRIKAIVSICQKLGNSKDEVIQAVSEECGMDQETARKKVDAYWEGM